MFQLILSVERTIESDASDCLLAWVEGMGLIAFELGKVEVEVKVIRIREERGIEMSDCHRPIDD